jgi:hypothetical protein
MHDLSSSSRGLSPPCPNAGSVPIDTLKQCKEQCEHAPLHDHIIKAHIIREKKYSSTYEVIQHATSANTHRI